MTPECHACGQPVLGTSDGPNYCPDCAGEDCQGHGEGYAAEQHRTHEAQRQRNRVVYGEVLREDE